MTCEAPLDAVAAAAPARNMGTPLDARRIAEVVASHFDFIWRSLRRLGVPTAVVDDAAQQVFLVASRKMVEAPPAKQRSFLFAIALRVAAEERRSRRRRPDQAGAEESFDFADPAPRPDEVLERNQARSIADYILESMPLEMRVVFVLYEVEEMTMHEIAELLEIAEGTVASRLRRARELFRQEVERYKSTHRGGSNR